VVGALGTALDELGIGLAVEPCEHAPDHPAIDGAQHVRIFLGGGAEGAVLVHDPELVVSRLGVSGEPVGGEGVGHRPHGGAAGALSLGGRHLGGEMEPVFVAHVLGHLPRLFDGEAFERPGQQRADEGVAPGRERQGAVDGHGAVALGRPARRLLAGEIDISVGSVFAVCSVAAGVMAVGGLPLPLGLDVVRKDLGEKLARELSLGLRDSIEYGYKHQDESIPYALGWGRGIDAKKGETFVKMYVNDLTIDMGERGKAGLKELFRRAGPKVGLPAVKEFRLV